MSPALAGESFTTEPLRKSFMCSFIHLPTHPVHSSLYPSTHPPSIHLSRQSPILFNHPFINLIHSSIVHCGSTRHILPPSDPVSFLEVLLTHPSSQHPTHTSSSLPTYPSHTFTYCPLSTHQILSPIIFFLLSFFMQFKKMYLSFDCVACGDLSSPTRDRSPSPRPCIGSAES